MASWEIAETTTERWWLSIATKIMAEWLQIGIESEDYREPSTEGTDWDVYQTAYRTGCWTTILEGYKPAWPRMNITTNGTELCMRLGRAQTRLNLYGMNDHFMRSLRDRYEVIYDWPTPTAMIPRAEETFNAATMITDWLGLRSSRGIGRARVLAHLEV